MPLKDRKINGNPGSRTPPAEHAAAAADAASWMQVALGAIGVVVAIVAAVFAYFAWIQPHSSEETGRPPAAANTAGANTGGANTGDANTGDAIGDAGSGGPAAAGGERVPLSRLRPVAGAAYIHAGAGNLTMPCASGQSSDRQRTVEYDLLNRYTSLATNLTVSKAPDADSRVQIKIFSDGREVANRTLKRGPQDRLDVPFEGVEKMRIQLICESPESELTLGDPSLVHS
ncbi:MAG TPA: hypothetical protein VFW27_33975 [Actinoplanes sp.]|nr:hypothetical protein [Actinoplanes sp.]